MEAAAGCNAWFWTAAGALESAEAFEISEMFKLDELDTYERERQQLLGQEPLCWGSKKLL